MDAVGLLDLVVMRGSHLGLIAGPIPLQTTVYTDLFVSTLYVITRLGLFGCETHSLGANLVHMVAVDRRLVAGPGASTAWSLIILTALSHLGLDSDTSSPVHDILDRLVNLLLLGFV